MSLFKNRLWPRNEGATDHHLNEGGSSSGMYNQRWRPQARNEKQKWEDPYTVKKPTSVSYMEVAHQVMSSTLIISSYRATGS
ncbi:hypothetical protein AVEN_105820-1 [Araneus ventricosus]|uniref:Uncharacterized protein n=1 Tax=Araneus ventricosus TaxID=182803 RepID=A0A4Y2S557_ARAVE|nr:hypothetical protein AVEN_105820-1 [Araneus ventricosus]